METRTCVICGAPVTRKHFSRPVDRTTCCKRCAGKSGGHPRIYKTAEESFWSKVDKSGDCWIWTAAKDLQGYGLFKPLGGKTAKASRAAWMFAYGDIPAGKQVNHICNNPSCVRPDHLYLGTQHENMLDAVHSNRHGRRGHHELKPEQVISIRREYSGWRDVVPLAEKYGVSRNTISSIVAGRTWKYLLSEQ